MEEGCGAREGEVGKGYRSRGPLCPATRPERCVRDGDLFLLLLMWCARVGCAWVCVSVRPGFSMCRGGASGGGVWLLVQLGCFLQAGSRDGYFFGSAALRVLLCAVVRCCCAVLLCLEAGTQGPRWAWCGVADGGGGGDLVLLHGWVWRVMRGGGHLTDDGHKTHRDGDKRASPRQEEGR